MPKHAYQALVSGYHRFRTARYPQQAALYEALGDSQSPRIMVISCADSRCDPGDIFEAAPGTLFTVRNVANLVPPYIEADGQPGVHGVSAAVEFAVKSLKVAMIVVMGHAGCGGIKASIEARDGDPVGGEFLGPWVELLTPARERAVNRCTHGHGVGHDDPMQRVMEEEVVAESLKNLSGFPFVADALAAGTLELHGAWFSIGSGELHWRDPASGVFAAV
ncbi:MAG: carbonic anhydrase [Hyphomonadaceae bacterium]|nr:carbonic anhydrase [Hyphomonadaceae bacterium]